MATLRTVTNVCSLKEVAVLPRPHLFVVMNCASPLQAPSRHALDGVDEVLIGRGVRGNIRRHEEGKNTLAIALSDPHVSSAQARLVRRDHAWVLEDLGSKNGSFVNGAIALSMKLADGDCLQVGQTLLTFRDAVPTPCDAAADMEANGHVPALATLMPLFAHELDVLARAAASQIPVLLISETGTGKELLAQAVHLLSRRKGSFVPLNCSALPATLVESVLFGHKRGAFSGAVADSFGLVRSASGGTLLLDEIGDMAAPAQAAILRTVQNGEVLPVGATQPVHVDVRFVAATHCDLEARVSDGRFREDLFARLSGFTFRLPPLRERREDIGLLVSVLLRSMSPERNHSHSLSAEAGAALLRYSWPLNVRELERCLAHAVALAGGGRIDFDHLPQPVRRGVVFAKRSSEGELRTGLTDLLRKSRGNISFAATSMRTSRSQIHRWIKRFAIDVREFRH